MIAPAEPILPSPTSVHEERKKAQNSGFDRVATKVTAATAAITEPVQKMGQQFLQTSARTLGNLTEKASELRRGAYRESKNADGQNKKKKQSQKLNTKEQRPNHLCKDTESQCPESPGKRPKEGSMRLMRSNFLSNCRQQKQAVNKIDDTDNDPTVALTEEIEEEQSPVLPEYTSPRRLAKKAFVPRIARKKLSQSLPARLVNPFAKTGSNAQPAAHSSGPFSRDHEDNDSIDDDVENEIEDEESMQLGGYQHDKEQQTDESDRAKMCRRSSWYNPTEPWDMFGEDQFAAASQVDRMPARSKSADDVLQPMPSRLMAVQKKKEQRMAAAKAAAAFARRRSMAQSPSQSDGDTEEGEDIKPQYLSDKVKPEKQLSPLAKLLSSRDDKPNDDNRGNDNDDNDNDDDDEHSVNSWCNIDTSESTYEDDFEPLRCVTDPTPTAPVQRASQSQVRRHKAAKAAQAASLLTTTTPHHAGGMLDDDDLNDEDAGSDQEDELLLFNSA